MFIHFTKSIEALDSILKNGFLYLHNETGILRPALQDAFGVNSGDSQSSGMICFTELAPKATESHQASYGKFGVGVSRSWLIANKARKVEYMEVYGEKYNALVSSLKTYMPQRIQGISITELLANAESMHEVTQALSGNFLSTQDVVDNSEYLKLIDRFLWTQTHRDIAESEWRVRNPKPYRFKGNPTRKQQVDLLVSCISNTNIKDVMKGLVMYTIDGSVELACVGKLSLALRLAKEAIEALFCPKENAGLIKYSLEISGMNHIPVYVSDNDNVLFSG